MNLIINTGSTPIDMDTLTDLKDTVVGLLDELIGSFTLVSGGVVLRYEDPQSWRLPAAKQRWFRVEITDLGAHNPEVTVTLVEGTE